MVFFDEALGKHSSQSYDLWDIFYLIQLRCDIKLAMNIIY